MTRDPVRTAIKTATDSGRAALICYLPAGYPDPDTSLACLRAAATAGADVLEIGFPFSDPVMDGPTIQAANQAVLEAGMTVDDNFALCKELTRCLAEAAPAVPSVVMTYVTIPAARGWSRFAADARQAGLVGAILPDLPPDHAADWLDEARHHGLATIFLASQTSSEERLATIAARSSGFVYATSLLGVTGARDRTPDASDLVARIRRHTDLPVAVGLGVSTGVQAQAVASYADGVIVGSAIVGAVGDGSARGAPERVHAVVAELRAGVEAAAGG